MKKSLLTIMLLALVSLNAKAQLDSLLTFNGTTNGSSPAGSLISDGTYLYGMTSQGGTSGVGLIFKIKPDGTGYVDLLDFNGTNGSSPYGSLITDGTYLYGMTSQGGANGVGVVFKVQTDGSNYTDLLDFNGTNGSSPQGSLISDGTYLYGMTNQGGANGVGVVFKVQTDGSNYTDLLDFNYTNGATPYGSLYSDGTYLYGMTQFGGTIGAGNVFKVKTDGTGYADLLDFNYTNGATPYGSLYSDGTYLYGITSDGGANSFGNIFKIKTDGGNFADILDFNATTGTYPYGSLISDGTYLYGMTKNGGANADGNIFKIKTDGTGYADLADFNGTNGQNPNGDLLLQGNVLYGMSPAGGTNNYGTIFKYTPAAGAALNFDGVDDYVSITNNAALNITNAITIESWIKTTNSPTSEQYIVTKNDDSYFVGLNVAGAVGQVSFYLNGVSSGWLYSNSTTLTDNNWHHVACTYDGATMSIYVDGVLDISSALTGTISTGVSNLYLGSRNNNQFLQGSMDEFRIWNRAVCQSEIQNNMMGEVATNANGLVAYYKFNQGYAGLDNTAITALTDSSSNALNGTFNNFALTGATSNFVTPGAVTTGSLVTAFTNSLSAVATQTNVSCYGYSDGIASVAVTGVGSPTYAWSAGGTTSNTNTYTSLSAGNYTCTIGNGCGTITQTFTITIPTQLVASSTSGTIACNGGITTVTVSATGGTQNYGGDAGVSTNVTAGSYTYTVIDANQCTATTTITISQPAQALMASSTSGTIACNGGATTVTVSATGGTTNYTGTGTFTATAGPQTYTVTDANQCTATTTVTLTQPTQVTVTATAGTIACNGGTTTVTVSATGGTPTYSNTGTFTVTASVTQYTYIVTDANSCTGSANVAVSAPPAVNASVTVNSTTITAVNASATYQWVNCATGKSAIAGATHRSFTPLVNGSYAVVVTQGLCSDTSTCTTISTVGIAQYNTTNNLQVYPNPFSNQLTIVSSAKTIALLFDMLGNQIRSFNLEADSQTISLSDLAPGMYYLQVDAQKIKIIKQ